MTTTEIANKLVAFCRKGEYQECYKELYSPQIKSIENDGSVVNGFEEMAEKGKQWNAGIKEFHGSSVGDPIVSGNYFSLPMSMTITYQGGDAPIKFEEICVYKVKDGKVVQEQFFYDDPPTA